MSHPFDLFLQFTQYFAFCAVVILYVYTIQQAYSTDSKHQSHFDAAERCQRQIAIIAESGSLAQRYGVVLEELRLEAINQTQRHLELHSKNQIDSTLQSSIPGPHLDVQQDQPSDLGVSREPGLQAAASTFPSPDPSAFDNDPNSTTASSLIAEMTSWGEFDSLVSLSIQISISRK